MISDELQELYKVILKYKPDKNAIDCLLKQYIKMVSLVRFGQVNGESFFWYTAGKIKGGLDYHYCGSRRIN